MAAKENFFSRTMSLKTDDELQIIIKDTNSAKEWLLAAEWEVEKRKNAPLIDEEKNEKQGLPVLETQEEVSLFSTTSVFIFSMLFSTFVGGGVLAYNMFKIKKMQVAMQIMLFVTIYSVASNILFMSIGANIAYLLLFNIIGAFILTEFFFKKHITSEIKYRPKNAVGPILIFLGVSALLGFMMLNSNDPQTQEMLKQMMIGQ